MSTLASLNIMIGANSAVLRKELKRSTKSVGAFVRDSSRNLAKFTSGAAGLTRSLGRNMAIGTAAVGAGVVAIERTLKSIDDIRREAANVSLPVEQYQAYAFATRAAGLESDQFADVVKDLNAKITDFALTGGGAMADFFKVTGQSIEEWQRLQPAEQFERFTSEINKMSESQARFWLDEINDSAAQMFGTLVGNKGEFASNVQLAKDLGLVMSAEVVAGVQHTYREVNTLKALLGSAWQHTIASAGPVINYITQGIRNWISESAEANGGFANLGKTLATSMLSGVQSVMRSISQMMYEAQAIAYKLTGEQNGWYIAQTRNLRQINREYDTLNQSIEGQSDAYQFALQALSEYEQGTRSLSEAQVAQAKEYISAYEGALDRLGALGMSSEQLAAQIDAFEEKEGIRAPFQKALSTIDRLKQEVADLKIDPVAVPDVQAPDMPDFKPQSVTKNPYESQLQQAQEYFAQRRLMRENDWSEERAALQLKLNEYKSAKDSQLLSDREYYMLKQQAELEYEAQHLSFLDRLKQQMSQTTQDFDAMWGNTFDRFTQGIGESVANAVMTQQSFSESMKGVMRGVVKSTIAALAEMAAKRLAVWAIEKLINKASAVSAGGAVTAQAQAMSMMAGINAFSSTAAIPMVGPFMAPGAMASALAITQPMAAAVAGFSAGMVGMAHSGIDYVPREGTWLLDKGERVYTNQSVRQLDAMGQALQVLAANQAAGSQPANNYHFSMSVDALDSRGFDTWYQDNRDDVLRDIQTRFNEPV